MIKCKLNCKVLIITVLLTLPPFHLIAADRYSVTSGNWNSASTWSDASGGLPGASVPVAGDSVFIETGHTITVTANASCSSITFTGTSGNLIINSTYTLTISGSVTFLKQSDASSSFTFSGAGIISCSDIQLGTLANPPAGDGNTFTHALTTDVAVLNISNNLTVNSYYTGTSVKAACNGVFNLSSGTVTVGGSVITTIESNNNNDVTFLMTAGSGTGTLILNGSTPFNLSTKGTIIDLNGTSSLVVYNNSGSQTIYNTPYRNITLSGSGAKNIGNPGNVTVYGTLSMEGTATLSGKSPVYDAAARLQYKGSAAQTTGLEFPATFSGTGGVTIDNINGVSLDGNRTINSLLTFINGKISTGTFTLILGSAAAVSGAGSNKYVFGKLQKGIAAGTSAILFEIGDASVYAPVTIGFTGTTNGAGNLVANTTSGDHPSIGTSYLDPTYSVNRYWSVTNNGVTGFTSYSATLNYSTGDIDAGADYTFFSVGIYYLAAWTYPVIGTKTSTSIQATGMTTFGEFQIGRSLYNSFRTIQTGNWEQTGTWETFSGGTWIPATATPTSSDGFITISNPDAVTINSPVTIDEMTVDAGATLILNSSVTVSDASGTDVSVNGTLDCGATANLTGTGSFALSAGASIIIRSPGGISFAGSTGNIQTASRVFNSGANYFYSGTSSQITGDGLPSLTYNLSIDNLAGVTLTSPVTIYGTLSLVSGAFSTSGNSLFFHTSDTPISRTSGTITTSVLTDLSFGTPGNTSGAAFTIPSGVFTSAPTIRNLSVYRTNNLTLNDQMLSVAGILLCNGPLSTNGNLTLLSTTDGTALIDGSSTGLVTGNVTMQRYLPSGFGYKYFSSPFQSATVNEFSDDLALGAFTFFRYDENRTSSGWVSYNSPVTNPLVPMQGYAVNFGSGSAPNTVDITGNVNNGNISATLYNHHYTYTNGFNLVGNPYPSPIDWDATAGWTKTNIDDAVYYFKASTTDQYGGTYSSYVAGVSSDGLATNIIPSMQGFFVHVTDGTYPVTGTLAMNNSVRINDLTHAFTKSKGSSPYPQIRLSANFSDDPGSTDPLLIYFNEKGTDEFDSHLDALKLLNTDLSVPNLYVTTASGAKLSISAFPPIKDDFFQVPLGLKLNRPGNIVIRISDIDGSLEGRNIYLSDALTGTEKKLLPDNEFSITLSSGEYLNRFYLNFADITTAIEDTKPANELIKIYSSMDLVKADITLLQGERGTLKICSLTGQVLFTRQIHGSGHYEFRPGLKNGFYIVTFGSSTKIVSKKIILQY